ncbi:MAG: CinA family protein [Alphaproteobacteria bacterium]|nr:CinA family protein [Alphaproteobacteria bacterium]MCD8520619.1 CinA family protein [Alphaproteobacteria bacterium]MCD8526227.1 CinA family protein [Alphaproteobacteria bacterium]MCD8570755.1 CinA family protein [Alphaproteobacteria bacterium]
MQDLLENLGKVLTEKKLKVAVAESCTGGLLAAALTHRSGSSTYFDRGFITYSNDAKMYSLNVPEQMLVMNGAVSAQVAEAMARGALKHSRADIALSTTGVAGPTGGTPQKPVGMVFIGYAVKGGLAGSVELALRGTREQIRGLAVAEALQQLIKVAGRTKANA